jgi:hypothetical protein
VVPMALQQRHRDRKKETWTVAIINMISNNAETFPEGAYAPIGDSGYNTKADRAKWIAQVRNGEPVYGPIILYTSHHGLCIRDYERNGYDDSDFHMIVWNEEKGVTEDICFASTRGWSYPCYGSYVDATPEVLAKYEAWKAETAEKARTAAIEEEARNDIKLAEKLGLSGPAQAKKLRDVFGMRRIYDQETTHWLLFNERNAVASYGLVRPATEEFVAIFKLLSTKKFRSDFRAQMAQQVRAWLEDTNPRYAKPLSPKQMRYV